MDTNTPAHQREHIAVASDDLLQERLDALKHLFPEVVTEGKIDVAKLRALLGDMEEKRPERYTFGWAGKRNAIRLAQTPSTATLVPDPDQSVNFDTTQNLFIGGDNLEVLKLLHRAYFGRVKMIYIDPPYNTGNDFVYPDDYADPLEIYLQITGQRDTNGHALTSNPEKNGRYHSRWLSMMYPRLALARSFLSEDGVIFVSIDDHEVYNLRLLMNEIFGEENFICTFTWQAKKGGGSDSSTVVTDQEYILCFGKTSSRYTLSRVRVEAEELDKHDSNGPYRRGRELNKWGSNSRRQDRPTMFFPIPGPNGVDVFPIRNDGEEGRWRWGKKKMLDIAERGDIEFVKRSDGTYIAYEKIRSLNPRSKPYRTWLTDVGTTAEGSKTLKDLFAGRKVYDFPKPVALIKRLLTMGTIGDGDIVLDFFAGSCSTAQAVLELNREDDGERQFIMIQLPERTPEQSEAYQDGYYALTDIGKERINRVLSQMWTEQENTLPLTSRDVPEDVGFRVFHLAPSHLHQWQPPTSDDPAAYIKQLSLIADLPLAGVSAHPHSVIWEVALREGYSLAADVEIVPDIATNRVYRVVDSLRDLRFHITLDDQISLETVHSLGLAVTDLFVCRDDALNDTIAANLALHCRLKTI